VRMWACGGVWGLGTGGKRRQAVEVEGNWSKRRARVKKVEGA
jgi:hypothetical protein